MPTAEELAQSQNQQTQPPAIDEATLGNMVNAAVTAHLKRANIAKLVTDTLEAALKPVKEQMEAASKQPPAEEKPKTDPKATPEFAALQRQLDEVNAKLKTEGEGRAAAEKRQREDKAYADLRAGLASAGIKQEMVDIAADNLFYAKKKVEFDTDGNALFRSTKTTPGFGDEDELLPLSAGIQAFVKSKDAAPFLPAPNASKVQPLATRRQSTSPPQAIPQPAAAGMVSDDDRVANAMAREESLKAQFPHLAV